MLPNPLLGVVFHWLGGLASGSFYVPYRAVQKWSWETYWLVGGFFSWILMPVILASCMTQDLFGVLSRQSVSTLAWTGFFGAMWGFGGLTFGLTMRYLGMSLGMGIALGYCAAFGTLLPPIAKSLVPILPVTVSFGEIVSSPAGLVTIGGVATCLLGIFIAALAGLTKEREMSEKDKHKAIKEFNFAKGIIVATFSGVMSACFAFALTAGNPIGEASRLAGTPAIWSGLPKLTVVLLGGFVTNFVWCVLLNFRNRSGYQYFSTIARPEHARQSGGSGQHRTENSENEMAAEGHDLRIPVLKNYVFSAMAGIIWYLQFFFYTMGESQMGRFGFASWTLHMASIIIFSTLWGWYFHEWRGASRRAHWLIFAGIAILILSTMLIGFGTWMKSSPA